MGDLPTISDTVKSRDIINTYVARMIEDSTKAMERMSNTKKSIINVILKNDISDDEKLPKIKTILLEYRGGNITPESDMLISPLAASELSKDDVDFATESLKGLTKGLKKHSDLFEGIGNIMRSNANPKDKIDRIGNLLM